MDPYQKKLFAFLVGNMKEMEVELRAQSIVLDALANRVIAVEDMAEALGMARRSTKMLELVRSKYCLLGEAATGEGFRSKGDTAEAEFVVN